MTIGQSPPRGRLIKHEDDMQILAVNSSPRNGGQSKTERMLHLAGAKRVITSLSFQNNPRKAGRS